MSKFEENFSVEDEDSLVDERKRKLSDSSGDESKKPKLNTSLGLSLLQAYDEEEQYSDDEIELGISAEEIVDSQETTLTKDAENDSEIGSHISSLMVEEEEEEVGFNTSIVEKTKFDLRPNQVDIVEHRRGASVNSCNSEDISDETIEIKLNSLKYETNRVNKEELKCKTNDTITKTDYISNLDVSCVKTNTSRPENVKEVLNTIRPDYNFSVFGKNENTVDSSDSSSSKPIKKVKLNRSKFVRPADESSSEAKISPSKVESPSVSETSNIQIISVVEEREVGESTIFDSALSDTSNSILVDGNQDITSVELMEELSQETIEIPKATDETIYHSISEQTMNEETESKETETCLEISNKRIYKEKLQNEITEASKCSDDLKSHALTQNISDESLAEPNNEEVELTKPVRTATSDPARSNFSVSSVRIDFDSDSKRKIAEDLISCEDELIEGESSDEEDLSSLLKTPIEKEEPIIENIDTNDEITIQESLLGDDSNDAQFALKAADDENSAHSNLEEMEDPDETLEQAKHKKLGIRIQLGDIAEDENTVNSQTCKILANVDDDLSTADRDIEEVKTKVSSEFVNKPEHATSDEEIFEDAVESVEVIQSRASQQPKPIETTSKLPEISKLEQALTGRLGSMQKRVNKFDIPICARKECDDSAKAAVDDTKRNIKLHLSLQGDRVSIKNTQPTPDTTPPIRVKRQYRKRVKPADDLETKQASAKEYTNRLRQRNERETPGAKKRGRKKKIVHDDSTNLMVDSETNSSQLGSSENSVSPVPSTSDRKFSLKTNVICKVQPIKLKISKDSNVTIASTHKYDLSSTDEESNTPSSVDVNEVKAVSIMDDIRNKEAIVSRYTEKTTTSWSGPDLQRVERLLKESNVTITAVVGSRDVSTPPTTILKPIPDSTHQIASGESTKAVPDTLLSEESDNEMHLHTSSNIDFEELILPDIVEKSSDENSSRIPITDSFSKPVDVKFEIRKKIALVEKRKQEIEMDGTFTAHQKIEMFDVEQMNVGVADSTDTGAEEHKTIKSEPILTSTPKINITPTVPAMTFSKLPNLPTELFPKKRGRPTKAMVAAREAYRQQQEEIEKSKIQSGEVDTAGELNASSSEVVVLSVDTPKIKRGRKPKGERAEKKDSDDLSYEDLPPDPVREAEELKRLEEERIRKEEERERKNELRRLKAKERSDLVKAKRLRQKMKAKERHKMAKELRRLQQEEKKKLEEQLKRLPVNMGFDDETRMSAENSQAANMSFSIGTLEDDSSSALNDLLNQKMKKSRMEVTDSDSKDLMVDQIAEYQWPIQGGDLYMIQEQVSNFLGVKSFKRKYPDIWRRPVDSEERAYLVDSGLVSETLCDLGITAVRSSEVLDIMCSDFPEKYEEFRRYMRDKQMKELSFKQKAWANGLGYKLLMADGSKQDMKKRAMESASNWNSALNKSRVEDRRCHMDLQTFIIHFPKHRGAKMTVPSSKVGSYPVTILPGQFCDYYKDYTPTELRYLPVNTVLYGPLKAPTAGQSGDASQTDSDDSSSSDESSTTSEDTQATEETLEDIDKDIPVDEAAAEKSNEMDCVFPDEKEQMQKELMNGNSTHEQVSNNDCDKILCNVCLGDQFRNKSNVPEPMIGCSHCSSSSHPTCLDLPLTMIPRIQSYNWQCPDCKICAQCKENADEDKMLFCDNCDRGYHIYCVGLNKVPAGNWQCRECTTIQNDICVSRITIPKAASFIEIVC